MSKAYMLITSQVGKDDSIIALLRNIATVKEAHGAFGAYDIIVKLEADSEENLHDEISNKIRKIQEIRSTLTLLVKDNGFNKTTELEEEILKKHMTQAYVIIHCSKLNLTQIVQELKKIPEIIECDSLLGTYELICKMVAPSYDEISNLVSKKIRKISDIKATTTLNIIENQGFNK
ncbi:MAG: Lrp/AsnC ligand binding domain-containing protein [Nitrosopumilaceae archaeon]|nr:Lrp/AsnC ligand binding domain-containing protein [Nitrosopumilaceae archaeon]